jgi:hypothetical protein
MGLGNRFVAASLQGIGLGVKTRFGRFATALQASELLVQVELIQRLGSGGPILFLGHRRRVAGHWLGCSDRLLLRRRWLNRGSAGCGAVLFQQLLGRIEHLQAMAAADDAASHAQLVMGDAKAGLAMRALGDETVGHAAIRELCRGIV